VDGAPPPSESRASALPGATKKMKKRWETMELDDGGKDVA
jgi:hypothetical protein